MIGLDLTPGAGQRATADPLARYFASGGGSSVGLSAGPAGSIAVWTELAPNWAARLRFDNTDTSTRLSWRETQVMELRNIYPVAEFQLSGSWSQLQTSGSGVAGSYVGNRAVSTGSQTATLDVTIDRSATYDVWVCYTGRVSGSYCRVDIDGDQTLVNEIDDPGGLGFRAFSTYTDTDLQRRQSIKVASGLTGSHTVRLSNAGIASPGGGVLMVEAIAITGTLGDPRILPPAWQPNHAYAMGDEVQYGGVFYSARAGGNSGATGPTHTTGIATDGALDWRADDRSTYPIFVAIDYPSEREYAARFASSGPATEVGGQTHGNEILQSRDILIDGAPWTPVGEDGAITIGAQISMIETTTWQLDPSTDVGDCQLTRLISPGVINHEVDLVGLGPEVAFEWLYAGMVPMVRWDGEFRLPVIDTVEAEGSGAVSLVDYAGTTPADLNFPGAARVGLSGSVGGSTLTYGMASGALPLTGNAVNQFDTFLRPNIDATSEGGGADWVAKAYVAAGASGGLSMGSGDSIGFFSRHVLSVS